MSTAGRMEDAPIPEAWQNLQVEEDSDWEIFSEASTNYFSSQSEASTDEESGDEELPHRKRKPAALP